MSQQHFVFPAVIKYTNSKCEPLTLLRSKFSCVDTAVTSSTGSVQAEPSASRHKTLAALHIVSDSDWSNFQKHYEEMFLWWPLNPYLHLFVLAGS